MTASHKECQFESSNDEYRCFTTITVLSLQACSAVFRSRSSLWGTSRSKIGLDVATYFVLEARPFPEPCSSVVLVFPH